MSEKYSQIEQNAIRRKRGEFVHKIYERVQPVICDFVGLENSGTIANRVAEQALSEIKTRLDAAALDELDDTMRFLSELIHEKKEAE